MKRFSVKELRQWIMETATKAIQDDSFKTGTVFYKTLPGAFSFSQADIDDGMKSMAEIISKRRTTYCKRNKYYG